MDQIQAPSELASIGQSVDGETDLSQPLMDSNQQVDVTNCNVADHSLASSLKDETSQLVQQVSDLHVEATSQNTSPSASQLDETSAKGRPSIHNLTEMSTNSTSKVFDLDRVICVDDFQEIAKVKLEKSVYDYYTGGADDELSLNWNRSVIKDKYCLRPRVLCDVSQTDLTKYVFGDRLSSPIGISPTAMHKMAHPGGEKAMVRAANRINSCMILSLFSTTSLEDVAKQAPICPKWQNIYILKNRDITQNVINRAIRYGYRAIVVTCDAPTLGYRRKDVINNFTLGEHTLENIEDQQTKSLRDHSSDIFDPSVTWQDLAELKKNVGDTIRVIAKGIMTPEDARHALEAGVDGIFVSNHGGRQLDGCQSTIEALPAIVRTVNKRCPVFVDGGFRTGADILKALALGADMVFVGRPPLMGLAAFGEEGVYKAMKMLMDELRRAMMLCGCNKLADINSSMVIERF